MKIMIWIMLASFAIGGLWCLRGGLFTFLKILRRRPYLRRVQGTVLKVERKREVRLTTHDGKSESRTIVKFTPVIQFKTSEGETITFRSETGESYPIRKGWNGHIIEPISRYKTGQRIPLVYDPTGEIKPCQDDWASLYGMSTAMMVAGTLFMSAGAGMFLLYRDKLMF